MIEARDMLVPHSSYFYSQLRQEVSELMARLKDSQDEGKRSLADMDEERAAWRSRIENLSEDHRAEVCPMVVWIWPLTSAGCGIIFLVAFLTTSAQLSD